MCCPNCKNKAIQKKQRYVSKNRIFINKNLFYCASCNLVFVSPMPSKEDLSSYYTSFWNGEVATVSSSTRRYYMAQSISRIRYINQHTTIKENSAILDVGAGLGMFAEALFKERFKCQYNAIEPDKVQRFKLAKNKNIKNTYAAIEDVTRKNRFDLIILSHVLEHVIDPNIFIKNLTFLLNKDGLLFIEVPNEDYKYKLNLEPHLLFFNEKSLSECIKKHGNVIHLCSVGSEIGSLKEKKHNSKRNFCLNNIKELIKWIFILLDKNHINKQINKLQMSVEGKNRQWLRAIIQK